MKKSPGKGFFYYADSIWANICVRPFFYILLKRELFFDNFKQIIY